MTFIADVFSQLQSRKTVLDKCLKSPLSEDPSKSNMIKACKHCYNLNYSAFAIFIDQCEGNWIGKSFF